MLTRRPIKSRRWLQSTQSSFKVCHEFSIHGKPFLFICVCVCVGLASILPFGAAFTTHKDTVPSSLISCYRSVELACSTSLYLYIYIHTLFFLLLTVLTRIRTSICIYIYIPNICLFLVTTQQQQQWFWLKKNTHHLDSTSSFYDKSSFPFTSRTYYNCFDCLRHQWLTQCRITAVHEYRAEPKLKCSITSRWHMYTPNLLGYTGKSVHKTESQSCLFHGPLVIYYSDTTGQL